MRRARMLGAALAAALLFGSAAPLSASAAVSPASVAPATVATADETTSGGLSASGQEAIADLRTCLASSSTLNVYYLVDSSLSLAKADDGGPGSDPDDLRAAILANSLEQLGSLGEGLSVNWAAGFFSTEYSQAIGWRSWQQGGADELRSAIEQRTPGGYTNWPAALTGAQQQLAQQQQSAPGCQMLVWLTDGQIDIGPPDGQDSSDLAALNQLCGNTLEAGGAAATGSGTFNALRQSGVVVLGALLATDEASKSAAGVMQTLVEGSSPDTSVTCGENPIPDSYVHGAFVEAAEPDALAQVFLQLSAQVGGGYPHPFDADGGFYIDQGVARFRIVLNGSWTLTAPDGSGLAAASDASPQSWATVTAQNGSTVIDVDMTADGMDAATAGRWQLTAGDTRSLFLFSGLRIVFDEKNSVELSADGTASSVLKAAVVDADGDPVGTDEYGQAVFAASYLNAAGVRTPLPEATVDTATGAISIPLPADISAAQLTVTASLDPLATTPHDLSLAPVTTQQTVTTVLPKNFPRATALPVQLSTLEGARGEATGALTVTGPEEGGAGTVCLPDDPTVTSDAGARADWQWNVATSLDGDRCVTVEPGQQVDIAISAANAVAADSVVQASVPVQFRSADGDTLTQDVPIRFTSTHPVNAAAVGLLALVLLILGILLPLVLLWIINRATTRIGIPANTQRAAFPVTVARAGASFTGVPAEDSALSDAFRYLAPSAGVRSLADPDLGELRARVPWFPIAKPWYEVAAPRERAIVTARAGRHLTGERTPRGDLRFAQLPLDRFWALVVPRAELLGTRRGDDVRGTVVLYHRAAPGESGQHRRRIAEIENDTALLERIDRLRETLRAEMPDAATAAAAPGPGGGSPSVPAASSTPAPPARSGAAPGGPPPRSAPGRSGAASAPPPGTAPGTGTHAGPGAPPPPRSGGTPPPPPRRR